MKGPWNLIKDLKKNKKEKKGEKKKSNHSTKVQHQRTTHVLLLQFPLTRGFRLWVVATKRLIWNIKPQKQPSRAIRPPSSLFSFTLPLPQIYNRSAIDQRSRLSPRAKLLVALIAHYSDGKSKHCTYNAERQFGGNLGSNDFQNITQL